MCIRDSLYCAHCDHKLVGSYCTKQRPTGAYHRPIYRCYNGAVEAKRCNGQSVYSAKKIESAVLEIEMCIRDRRGVIHGMASAMRIRLTALLVIWPARLLKIFRNSIHKKVNTMIPTDLFSYAYIPAWYEQLYELSQLAAPEPWRFRQPTYETQNDQNPILERYINQVFRKQSRCV